MLAIWLAYNFMKTFWKLRRFKWLLKSGEFKDLERPYCPCLQICLESMFHFLKEPEIFVHYIVGCCRKVVRHTCHVNVLVTTRRNLCLLILESFKKIEVSDDLTKQFAYIWLINTIPYRFVEIGGEMFITVESVLRRIPFSFANFDPIYLPTNFITFLLISSRCCPSRYSY